MSPRRIPALAAVAVGALVVGLAAASPATAASEVSAPTTTLNGYRNVGYYGQWRATGEAQATVKRLFVDTAAAQNLTHLNYSFGNIAGDQAALDAARAAGVQGLDEVEPFTCFISDTPAAGPGQTDTAGDAASDFVHAFSAEQSVLGIADTKTQPLAGNFNQLQQLKRLYPDLKVNVSLGGWSWSKSFSKAVATPELRAALAESCIDLYIRGDLPTIDGRGGDGAAAGIFDGFDLDWEWPGAPDWAQEVGNSVDPVNDRANFLAFVKELRAQLDAVEGETGADYELSAFLPAGPTQIAAGGWNDPELFEYLDYANLQGYDLWGSWAAETGHQGNVFGDPAHNWGLGLDTVVASYMNAGIDPAQLNLGLAAYGQGWRDAEPQPWTTSGGGLGQITWDQLKTRDLDIHHEYTAEGRFNATWGYDPAAREFWSFDDELAVAEKTRWAIEQGLGGVDFWEIGNDVAGDLSAASADVLRAAAPGPVSGPPALLCAQTPLAPAAPWNAQTTYRGGELVHLDGRVFEAQWYARGDEPGASVRGPWSTLTACGVHPDTVQDWYADRIYGKGDQVVHDGVTYTAQWWSRADEPGGKRGPWKP
ncbi:glycosyl hydrolase family 18 protein [Microbacterium salsuginis]|uniref:glycosyl hydrolase family 18 protein n=1 Tax=Microbacterium salsuginis TaxID=2722803 RepID=UPI00197BB00E